MAETVTVFFPVYRDELTVGRVTEKAIDVCRRIADDFEVIIVDDGSPDRAGAIADELAARHPEVRVIHHGTNRGYGAAVRTGLAASTKDWICFTDGDDEYDLYDLERLWRLRHHYDLIITFRYVRRYSGLRILISWIYNWVLRFLFYTRFRDISTGLRLVRREVVEELDLEASSPFIGAEIAIKTMFLGHPVGEVGIQTFPRDFRRGQSTSPRNIVATIIDMLHCRRRIFSPSYRPSGPGSDRLPDP